MNKNRSSSQPVPTGVDTSYIPEGYVPVDRAKLKARMKVAGIATQEQLANSIDMSRATTYRIFKYGYVRLDHFQDIAKALKTNSAALSPSRTYFEDAEPKASIPPPNDWSIVRFETSYLVAANGVSYCVAQLQSQLVSSKFARGKFYCLLNVLPSKFADLRERLVRHPTVCERLKNSKHIIRNREIRRMGQDSAWWVLDDWIDGETLEALLEKPTKFTLESIKRIGGEILLGLSELHAAGVVMRELAPERVIVANDQSRCTLVDFELAKLFSGNPSVSGDWKLESPYRAPEIDADSVNEDIEFFRRVDFFSWAGIIIELVTGDPDASSSIVTKMLGDKKLADVLLKCRSPQSSLRPISAESILETWGKWKPKN